MAVSTKQIQSQMSLVVGLAKPEAADAFVREMRWMREAKSPGKTQEGLTMLA